MSEERYVAAIEISSSKILAEVGIIHDNGRLEVVACEQDKGVEGVRYGVIQNLEETYLRIMHIIERLERRPVVSPRKIKGVFVGLSGRSLRSIPTKVSIMLPEETEINDEILARLKRQALETALDSSLEVIDAIPRTYKVGNLATSSPKGTIGNSISACFDLIVCRTEMKRNLVRTLNEKLGLRIEGVIVTALATGQLILTAEEKRLGCMLVDMGAETTTVTIYREGHLNYFATLPLGGRHITRDITSLKILEERAEDLKLSSGNAIARDNMSTMNINGVKMSDLSNLVVSRAEEIVANIVEQISYAGMSDKDLPGGIVCIGGGAKLNGMLDLLSQQSGLSVRSGSLPSYIRLDDMKTHSSDVVEATSVLYTGAVNSEVECLEVPRGEELGINGTVGEEPEPEPEPRKPRQKKATWLSGLVNKMGGFFSGPEEDDSDLLE